MALLEGGAPFKSQEASTQSDQRKMDGSRLRRNSEVVGIVPFLYSSSPDLLLLVWSRYRRMHCSPACFSDIWLDDLCCSTVKLCTSLSMGQVISSQTRHKSHQIFRVDEQAIYSVSSSTSSSSSSSTSSSSRRPRPLAASASCGSSRLAFYRSLLGRMSSGHMIRGSSNGAVTISLLCRALGPSREARKQQ